jgi:hypothetical protein
VQSLRAANAACTPSPMPMSSRPLGR